MAASSRYDILLFLALGVAVLSYIFPSQVHLTTRSRFDSPRFNSDIEQFIQERNITGLSVALTYDDRLIYASGFGYADVEAKVSVTVQDRFRLASVSKAITGIAIMKLVENGQLYLTDRVFGRGSILDHMYSDKDYNDWERNITLQYLLEHSLGFVNADMCTYRDLEGGCDQTIVRQTLGLNQWDLTRQILDTHTPTHAPGTYASYSNFGYFLAGRVVEEAYGQHSYLHIVEQILLHPLGIINMTMASDIRLPNEVKYYCPSDPKAPYKFAISRRDSVGAWMATPIDLVKLLTAVNGLPGRPDIINITTIETMFTKSTIADSKYAKGFLVRHDEHGLIDAWKDGGAWGTRSLININPRNETTYAIVVNSDMPSDESRGFRDGNDLKTLMDNLTFSIKEWPSHDLFAHFGG